MPSTPYSLRIVSNLLENSEFFLSSSLVIVFFSFELFNKLNEGRIYRAPCAPGSSKALELKLLLNGLIDFLIVGSARSLALFSWDFFDDDFVEIVGKKYLNINKNLPK